MIYSPEYSDEIIDSSSKLLLAIVKEESILSLALIYICVKKCKLQNFIIIISLNINEQKKLISSFLYIFIFHSNKLIK